MSKTTDIPGMEQSIMPLREMHALIAVGKGTKIDFEDAEKTIRMGFEVVDPSAIMKVKKGVLPCFSQGGNYAEKWADPKDKTLTRYAADPGEVSLVDRGCLPGAAIESIKNQSFEFVKSNGSMELRKFAVTKEELAEFAKTFAQELHRSIDERLQKEAKTKRKGGKDLHASDFAYVGDPEDTSTWKLPVHDAAHVRNALARFDQTQGIPADEKQKVKRKIVAAAHKFGVQVQEEAEKLMHTIQYLQALTSDKPIPDALSKGLYAVQYMAEVLECLQWLQQSATYERDYEGDASTQPEDLKTLLEDAITCFVAMVEEETEELAASAAALTEKGAKSMTPEQLKKAASHLANLHAHLGVMKAHHDSMVTHHAAHGDMHKAMSGHVTTAMEDCSKAMNEGGVSTGVAPAGAEGNVAGSGPHSVDIRAGGGAHQAGKTVEYVKIGTTADGVEVFKKVEKEAAEAADMDMNELIKKIGEQTQRQIDESMTMLIKGLVNPESLLKTEPAAGVGDRAMVVNRPAGTEVVVTKRDDALSGGAGAAVAAAGNADKPTVEVYRKGAAGDQDARIAFARSIKKMGNDDAARVQTNLASFARH